MIRPLYKERLILSLFRLPGIEPVGALRGMFVTSRRVHSEGPTLYEKDVSLTPFIGN
jgi:hypothetical protein